MSTQDNCLFWRESNAAKNVGWYVSCITHHPDLGLRVTYLKATLLSRSEASSLLRLHDRIGKQRQYGDRMNEVDRLYPSLVFATSGILGRGSYICMKSLVTLLTDKNPDLPYSHCHGPSVV